LFGAVALGLALAFGLGSRELAGEITRQWYEQYRAERDAIARQTAAHEQAEESEHTEVEAEATADVLSPPADDATVRYPQPAGR
jgi:hypothetical protein